MTPLRLRLLELRKARGFSTQAALAEAAGIRQATVSGLESGKTKRVDFETIEALAKVLGVQPHELFETAPLTKRTRR